MKKLRESFVAYALMALGVLFFACCSSGDDDNENGGGTDGGESSSKVAKAIDLGLPSGTKWADRNVGADSPEGYGDYFAYGDTLPKESYVDDNCVTDGIKFQYLVSKGILGNDGNLTAKYDAATVNWGDGWKTPTFAQIKELITTCIWTWKTKNGVEGYEVKSEKNGNSIFLPAAGVRKGASLNGKGLRGLYRSSTYYEYGGYYSYCLDFSSNGSHGWDNGGFSGERHYGYSVRPVVE